jgi:hypothetical protein
MTVFSYRGLGVSQVLPLAVDVNPKRFPVIMGSVVPP